MYKTAKKTVQIIEAGPANSAESKGVSGAARYPWLAEEQTSRIRSRPLSLSGFVEQNNETGRYELILSKLWELGHSFSLGSAHVL